MACCPYLWHAIKVYTAFLFSTLCSSPVARAIASRSANVLKEDNLSALSTCQRKRLRATGHFMAANSTCQSPYKHYIPRTSDFSTQTIPFCTLKQDWKNAAITKLNRDQKSTFQLFTYLEIKSIKKFLKTLRSVCLWPLSLHFRYVCRFRFYFYVFKTWWTSVQVIVNSSSWQSLLL